MPLGVLFIFCAKHAYQTGPRCEELASKMFAEKVWLSDFCLPPICVVLLYLLWEQDKDDKNKDTLEGHKDGEEVGKGKERFNFYHQKSNDPGYAHHHSERDRYFNPVSVWVAHKIW